MANMLKLTEDKKATMPKHTFILLTNKQVSFSFSCLIVVLRGTSYTDKLVLATLRAEDAFK